jgi:hypothetical protein
MLPDEKYPAAGAGTLKMDGFTINGKHHQKHTPPGTLGCNIARSMKFIVKGRVLRSEPELLAAAAAGSSITFLPLHARKTTLR